MRALANHDKRTLRTFAASFGVKSTMTGAAGFWAVTPLVDETWDVISVASLAIADLAGGGQADVGRPSATDTDSWRRLGNFRPKLE
jgi:hypothetical protein